MSKRVYHEYKGRMCSVAEISRMSGVPLHMLYDRLAEGWSVKEAIETPRGSRDPAVDPQFAGKILKVSFSRYIPSVFRSMQPELNTPYIAYPSTRRNRQKNVRPFYVVNLDVGNPLIVYPGEFTIIEAVSENDVPEFIPVREGERLWQAECSCT